MELSHPQGAGVESCDLLVCGASPAGIGAAVAAARQRLRVIVVEPLSRIGGVVTGGLGRTDYARRPFPLRVLCASAVNVVSVASTRPPASC